LIPYGKECEITYDWNGPESQAPRPGDALEGKARFYLVTSSRKVDSKHHPSRWKIRGVVAEDPAGAEKVFPVVWYKREGKQ